MSRNRISILLLALIAPAASCASVRERASWLLPGTAGRLAGDVVIQRDAWGIPHIYGNSDAAAAFGLGYAQAEDAFYALEALYIRALGRSSNLWGESQLEPDVVRASFDVQRLARAEYAREPTDRKRIWDAFAMGVNHYLDRHPEVEPRLLHRFEGWQAFAIPQSLLIDALVAPSADARELGVGWAVTPARTSDGRTYAVLELSGRADEADDLYEAHIESVTGWRFEGVWLFGTAAPVSGHNGSSAWSRSLDTGARAGRTHDLIPAGRDSGAYVSHGIAVVADRRVVELAVNTPLGVQPRPVEVRVSQLGPIVRTRGDTAVALEIDGIAEGGLLAQLIELSRTTSLDAFVAAAAQPAAPAGVIFYADSDGRIARGAVPAPAGTSASPVGSEPAAEPVVAPVLTTGGWALRVPFEAVTDADGVLTRLGSSEARLAAVAAALTARESWTFDEFAALAVAARYPGAADEVARLVDVWERIGATDRVRAAAADRAIDMLRAFDGMIDTTSAAATLYAMYAREIGDDGASIETASRGQNRTATAALDYGARLDALARAAARLRQSYARLETPPSGAWRLVTTNVAADTSPAAGMAVRAGPAAAGTVAAVRFTDGEAGAPGYVTNMRTWVMAVALGAVAEARSMVAFAGRRDSESAPVLMRLYAGGELKTVPFDTASVAAAAVRRYHPGERPGG